MPYPVRAAHSYQKISSRHTTRQISIQIFFADFACCCWVPVGLLPQSPERSYFNHLSPVVGRWLSVEWSPVNIYIFPNFCILFWGWKKFFFNFYFPRLWSACPSPQLLLMFAVAGISITVRDLCFSHISGTHSRYQPTLKGTSHNITTLGGCSLYTQV